MKPGKTADISIQKNFDNSFRGLPYTPRLISKDEIESLRQRHEWTTPPTLETCEMVFITSDTMDDFSSYAVWCWDVNDNLYLLECGEVPYIELTTEKRADIDAQLKEDGKPPVKTLEDILGMEWLVGEDGVGVKATFMVVDQGGHKAEEVKHFAKMNRTVLMQKGTSMTSQNWRTSDTQSKLILTNERYWKSTAIYYLYSQKNIKENYLYFYPEMSEEHLAEIRDMHPDNTSKWGSSPENWVPKTGKSHQFDCLKYAYFAKDFALATFMRKRYRFGKAPSILRRFEKQIRSENEKHIEEVKDLGEEFNK